MMITKSAEQAQIIQAATLQLENVLASTDGTASYSRMLLCVGYVCGMAGSLPVAKSAWAQVCLHLLTCLFGLLAIRAWRNKAKAPRWVQRIVAVGPTSAGKVARIWRSGEKQ